MMKRTILYLAALASTLPFFTEAGAQSFLEQNQKRDSVLIADQLKYGFSLEEFGPDSYAVKECPAFLALDEAEGFIASVLEDDAPGKGSGRLGRDAITMRACKAAVKGNDILSSEEIRQLLNDLQNTENPYSCPHGRPTFLTLTLGDIEHMFKRR